MNIDHIAPLFDDPDNQHGNEPQFDPANDPLRKKFFDQFSHDELMSMMQKPDAFEAIMQQKREFERNQAEKLAQRDFVQHFGELSLDQVEKTAPQDVKAVLSLKAMLTEEITIDNPDCDLWQKFNALYDVQLRAAYDGDCDYTDQLIGYAFTGEPIYGFTHLYSN